MSLSPESVETPGATPSRRLVPRLSSRPLKTLAPKPFQADRPVARKGPTTRAFSSAAGTWSCPVCPAFQRRACRLSSHKLFAKTSQRAQHAASGTTQAPSRQHADNGAAYLNSYAYRFAQSFVDGDIAAGRVDPFYKLPLPDSTHPQMHRLFHDFFTVQLSRAVNFPRPSCFPSDPLGGIIAPAAMIDPMVCLSVMSMAATSAGMRSGQPARNPSAQSFYSQAMQMLRSRLSNNSRTDETILAANALIAIGISFGVEAVVRQTRQVVRGLVQSRGGGSQLGMGGMVADCILLMEALAAIWLKDEPCFVSEATLGVLNTPPAPAYGAAFYTPPMLESFDPSMLEICVTMCRMTEVLEKAIREDVTPPEYIYLYSTLKWVSVRRAQFQARCYKSGTKDECLSNVIEIFRSNVFSTQPENKSLNLGFCSQLRRALAQTNISSYWDEHVLVLIWVLFVVGTIEFDWESRHWFLYLLRRSISHQYANEAWPATWRQEILQHLKSFLWSELRLAHSFPRICDELERLPVGHEDLETESSVANEKPISLVARSDISPTASGSISQFTLRQA